MTSNVILNKTLPYDAIKTQHKRTHKDQHLHRDSTTRKSRENLRQDIYAIDILCIVATCTPHSL